MANTFASVAETRRNNFDFLRFFFALMVLFSHCFPLSTGSNAREPLWRMTHGNETFGAIAVAGFFAISGFLIANSWANSRGALRFAWRRASRIYPGLIVAILFTAFVVGPLAVSARPHLRVLARSAISAIYYVDEPTIRGAFASNPLPDGTNGSMWTIWYELMCYVMIGALGAAGILRRRALVLVALIAALALYVTADVASTGALGPRIHQFLSGKLAPLRAPRLFAYFLAGTCFWAYRSAIPKSGWTAIGAAVAIVLAQFCGSTVEHCLLPIFGVYLLFWFAFSEWIPLQGFGAKGDFSYGLYLYAWPVTQLLVLWTGAKLHPVLLFFLASICTLPLAAASWYVVESPFLRRRGGARQGAHARQTGDVPGPAGHLLATATG